MNRQITGVYGITNATGILLTHVVADGHTFDAFRIAHELITGDVRYLKGDEELVLLSCVHCGSAVRLNWRRHRPDAMPWAYTSSHEPCEGDQADRSATLPDGTFQSQQKETNT